MTTQTADQLIRAALAAHAAREEGRLQQHEAHVQSVRETASDYVRDTIGYELDSAAWSIHTSDPTSVSVRIGGVVLIFTYEPSATLTAVLPGLGNIEIEELADFGTALARLNPQSARSNQAGGLITSDALAGIRTQNTAG